MHAFAAIGGPNTTTRIYVYNCTLYVYVYVFLLECASSHSGWIQRGLDALKAMEELIDSDAVLRSPKDEPGDSGDQSREVDRCCLLPLITTRKRRKLLGFAAFLYELRCTWRLVELFTVNKNVPVTENYRTTF